MYTKPKHNNRRKCKRKTKIHRQKNGKIDCEEKHLKQLSNTREYNCIQHSSKNHKIEDTHLKVTNSNVTT